MFYRKYYKHNQTEISEDNSNVNEFLLNIIIDMRKHMQLKTRCEGKDDKKSKILIDLNFIAIDSDRDRPKLYFIVFKSIRFHIFRLLLWPEGEARLLVLYCR